MVVVNRSLNMIHADPFANDPCAPEPEQLFLDKFYRYRRLPSVTTRDRDTVFMSRFWSPLFGLFVARISFPSAYHLEIDGKTEIVIRKGEEMIRAYVEFDKSNWDLYLTHFVIAHSYTIHTSKSFSFFYLNCREHPRIIPLGKLDFTNPSAAGILKHIHKCTRVAQKRLKSETSLCLNSQTRN